MAREFIMARGFVLALGLGVSLAVATRAACRGARSPDIRDPARARGA
jgi:hypothetical protein